MKNVIKFKDMPTKGNLKKFIEQRINCNNKAIDIKIKRISTYSAFCCIFSIQLQPNQMLFTPSFCKIQSIDTFKGRTNVILTISNDLHGYGSIVSENNFFKQSPSDLEKRNINLAVKITTF